MRGIFLQCSSFKDLKLSLQRLGSLLWRVGLIPGPGTSLCCRCNQREKKKDMVKAGLKKRLEFEARFLNYLICNVFVCKVMIVIHTSRVCEGEFHRTHKITCMLLILIQSIFAQYHKYRWIYSNPLYPYIQFVSFR